MKTCSLKIILTY